MIRTSQTVLLNKFAYLTSNLRRYFILVVREGITSIDIFKVYSNHSNIYDMQSQYMEQVLCSKIQNYIQRRKLNCVTVKTFFNEKLNNLFGECFK